FAPERAIRVRRSVSNDTPLPPEEPHGENPPAGALVDYVLQAAPSGPVTLEIFDAGGRLVRRFSSEDRPRPPAEPPQIAAEWLPLEIWNAMAEQYALRVAVRGVRDQLRPTAVPSLDSIAQGAGDGALAGLETVVESADRQPTQQSRDVFDGARARLARAQRRWQEFVTKDLPVLNAQRARLHLSPVTAPALTPD